MARGLSIVAVARTCRMSKQYLCDIEHGRRGLKMDMREASKLATCLEVPIEELTSRIETLTNREARQFSEYHRVLRSHARAEQAMTHVSTMRDLIQELRIAESTGKSIAKLLQRMGTVVEMLDTTLAYRTPRPKRWAGIEGDDVKLTPGRRRLDLGKVG